MELKPVGSAVRGYTDFITRLRRSGFAPRTVIDVGVATGTPWLHGAFPAAQLVLIEPNPRFSADLDRLAARLGAVVFRHALGAEAGELTIHEDIQTPSSSSAFSAGAAHRSRRTSATRASRNITVPLRTLDATLADTFEAPFLLKLDTEGFEREVLRGATATLRQTDVVIVEASVAPRFEGSYSFAELVALLDAHDFRFFDILSIKQLGKGGAINYMDAAFVRNGCDFDLTRR